VSQRNSANRDDGVVQKQPLNVYTVMLIVAFCAISVACLLLYMELRRWGSFPWWKPASGGGGAATSYLLPDDSWELPSPTRVA
jgi:hypothetical protein